MKMRFGSVTLEEVCGFAFSGVSDFTTPANNRFFVYVFGVSEAGLGALNQQTGCFVLSDGDPDTELYKIARITVENASSVEYYAGQDESNNAIYKYRVFMSLKLEGRMPENAIKDMQSGHDKNHGSQEIHIAAQNDPEAVVVTRGTIQLERGIGTRDMVRCEHKGRLSSPSFLTLFAAHSAESGDLTLSTTQKTCMTFTNNAPITSEFLLFRLSWNLANIFRLPKHRDIQARPLMAPPDMSFAGGMEDFPWEPQEGLGDSSGYVHTLVFVSAPNLDYPHTSFPHYSEPGADKPGADEPGAEH